MPGPIQSAEAQKLLAMLAAGGPSAGGSPGVGAGPAGAAGGPQPSPTGMALGAATQQLDGANPAGMAQTARAMSDALAQMYLMAAMRIPDVCDDISKARSALEKVFAKATKAQSVLGQVRPIMNSAGIGPTPGATPPSPDISSLVGASGQAAA